MRPRGAASGSGSLPCHRESGLLTDSRAVNVPHPATEEAPVSASPLSSRFGLRVQRTAHSHGPSVHIFLQRIVRQANGMLAVTPVCSSLVEMEGQIEQLKQELDEMLRQARQAFREHPKAAGA
jgi:hypothetical protein